MDEGCEGRGWRGVITAIQPRIDLWRSFDQRGHEYLGYAVRVDGAVGGAWREFTLMVSEAAHARHQLQAGIRARGTCVTMSNPVMEIAEYREVGGLEVLSRSPVEQPEPPPWRGVPPELQVYHERGYWRLDAETYDTTCGTCIWGCQMPVEMTIDHWNPDQKDYRFETFCFGPLSCRLHRAGPIRTVPGRKGMIWEEEDWVYEDVTSHRDPDE
jgi:hypothetical protein